MKRLLHATLVLLAVLPWLFGWHAADLPMPPVDTQMDDLSDTIPTEDPA